MAIIYLSYCYNSKTLEGVKERKNLVLGNIRELNKEFCTESSILYTNSS